MPREYRTPIALGAEIGDWTVIGPAAPILERSTDRRRGRSVPRLLSVRCFLCRCRCGVERAVRATMLLKALRGQRGSYSCGCYHRERTIESNTTHGDAPDPRSGQRESREYRAWASMKGRCYCPTTTHFEHYGGRGIAVCASWRDSFEAFLRDVGRKPTPKHSLDRIDVNGHYEPGNVRWATQSEQRRNTRKQLEQRP